MKMKNIYAAMSPNGDIARISIEDTSENPAFIDMTADELLTVIQSLRNVRAAMADKFPRKIEPGAAPIFRDVTRNGPFIMGREHVTAREVYIAFRHEGYGWLAFTMEEDPAAAMVLGMSQNIATMRPRILKPGPVKPPGGGLMV